MSFQGIIIKDGNHPGSHHEQYDVSKEIACQICGVAIDLKRDLFRDVILFVTTHQGRHLMSRIRL